VFRRNCSRPFACQRSRPMQARLAKAIVPALTTSLPIAFFS